MMISLRDVTFYYGSEETAANIGVEHIDMDIPKGMCVALCGKSGSGKSTMLRLINGLAPGFFDGHLTGDIEINGKPLHALDVIERTKTFGVVFQDPRSQFFMGKVRDEIAFSAENIGLDKDVIIEAVRKRAKLLQIEPLLDRQVDELSSLQKQRVAIAAATVLTPAILILDEPVSNLDTESASHLLEILAELKKHGTTILISEHRLHHFLPLVDQYIYINEGRIQNRWSNAEFRALSCDDIYELGMRHPDLSKTYRVHHDHAPSGEDSLTVEGISFSYKKGAPILQNASLRANKGDVIALLGENGTGKSTLCKIICGLLKPQKGNIFVNGTPMNPAKRRSISYLVMQDADYQLYADSIGNELVLGKKMTEELRKTAFEALDVFRLGDLKERHPASLSGGEKQRVTMAAAYCSDTDIIVLDEPTSGMDGAGVVGTALWLKQLSAQKKTVIVITHDQLLCDIACTKHIHLANGQIEMCSV